MPEVYTTVTLGFRVKPGHSLSLDMIDRQYTLQVLDQLNGNKTKTAELLGVDRRTLYRKLARWAREGARP